ncbi:MAG: SLC13 family permease [Candidatus Neomarinimicrobiota bacterium]|nr:MAG: SLC13 family permease [Candidatus Neomarinimicrobiota bacterium]
MTGGVILVLAILVMAFLLFITERFPIDVTALLVLGTLVITRLVRPAEALQGFANPAVITIALLFVLSHSLQKSGVLEYLVVRLNRLVHHSRFWGLLVYLLSIAIASAFVNNTAVVAIFMPITVRLAERYHISPSKVLIPLSYAAILGGTLTLIGTSTNLVVNSILVATTQEPPLGMFEFTRYGIIQLILGFVYIMLVGYRLLPSRTVTSSLTRNYHLGGYLTELFVTAESPLVGKTILERGINQNYDITVLDIQREGKLITSNIRNTVLQEGDILFVRGTVENFIRMKEVEKVSLLTDTKLTQKELVQADNVLIECIVTDKSTLVGKSLKESNFRRRFGSFVLAIRREGDILRRKIAHAIIRPFDTLLVYGSRAKIQELGQTQDFIVLEEVDAELRKIRFWWLSPLVIVSIVTLAAFQVLTIVEGALVGVILLLAFRVIGSNEAYESIHWQVVILIAAMIPLGLALKSTGTADYLSQGLLKLTSLFPAHLQPHVLLVLVYLVTMILTEMASNVVTAIIMAPLAITAAQSLGIDPRPLVFAVCFAASASFVTPIGYQTNMMVFGPGGYKFSDYLRTGLPLALLFWLTATLVLPRLWPF